VVGKDLPDRSLEPALTGASMARANRFDLELAEDIVLVFDISLLPKRSRSRRQRQATHPFRGVARLYDHVDMVVAAGPGAPVAAITMEFLAALGARRVVAVGIAGGLTPQMTHATAMPVAAAASDEGTSKHYVADHLRFESDAELLAALVKQTGRPGLTTLSTDAPFRHTPDRLASHRERATIVDMECSALFAAAQTFDIRAAALLVVSDTFDDTGWHQSGSEQTAAALRDAADLAADVLGPGA